MTDSISRGKSLWDALNKSVREYQTSSAVRGARRGMIDGVKPQGEFKGKMSAEQFFSEATDWLVSSGVVYLSFTSL